MGGKPRRKPEPSNQPRLWTVDVCDEKYNHHVFFLTKEDALKAADLIETCDGLVLDVCEPYKPPKATTLAKFCEYFEFDPPVE